ncbi:MAG TPA: PDZ domain-containing protein [Terriglobales bacterium]|nr:PDZ domain-containing protein [Terriglobales bacterium]
MKLRWLLVPFAAAFAVAAPAPSPATPLLLRNPTLSRTQIAFAFGGSIWVVPRSGGVATRLTAGPGVQSHPIFSPDGTRIAFTGEYDGNVDVFVVAASGGEPQRLTYHPGADRAVGWSPDGARVIFTSNRNSYAGSFDRLFSTALAGGMPVQLPLPMGEDGSYSPDGSHIAYVPIINWSARTAWKRYRGGRFARVWIANLADSSVVKVPQSGSNDLDPMWIGNDVYFLSDRGTGADGTGSAEPVALYRYDTGTRAVAKVLDGGGRDIKSAQAGPGAIVYEQLGSIHLYDLKSRKSAPVEIAVAGDFPSARPHFERVAGQIRNFAVSPSGMRAVFEAHGEILTVPAKEGDTRDITRTPGVEERSPAWSPDGQSIAYFSDASGDYALYISAQDGLGSDGQGDVRKISLGEPPSFFYAPMWSPDGKKIAYTDKRLNLWYVDLTQAQPTPVQVATQFYDLDAALDPAWSPDSQWLAYSHLLKSHIHAIAVYSLATGQSHQLTDGLSDARTPAFDASGKYLYFAASTNLGQSRKGIDMTGIDHPVTSSIYCLVLRKDLPSPLAPESDEEKPEAPAPSDGRGRGGRAGAGAGVPAEPAHVAIDFDQVDQRIVALPIPAGDYSELAAGKAGMLFLREVAPVAAVAAEMHPTLWRFDLSKRARERYLDNVAAWALSANGEKILYRAAPAAGGGGRGGAAAGAVAVWAIVSATAQPPRAGDGRINTATMEVRVDPPAEWRQMYHEVWRIERDFLYDPGAHGLDIPAAEAYYAQYLPGLVSRDDLNYLFNDMLGEITIGHMFIGGGTLPQVPLVGGGLLGADYRVVSGRYQFAKVYQGENWNPTLRAPLTEPGVNVAAGDYLLAVNGRDLRASDNLYSFFENTAGQQVRLRVGPNADGNGSRTVTVVPLASETQLRNRDWMDANRKEVDKLSQGKLAYIYLPDTANGGFTNFNRYYYAQLDKQGAVIDERFNSGGDIADYIIDNLQRPQFASFLTRQGAPWPEPTGSIYGPKAMIINAFAGSGGDAMPWMFRNAKVGPLVGTRTWGGLVGIGGYPVLMDGGTVTAPREAFYNMRGQWDVENHGVDPDYAVELDPAAWRQGHDPQLEKAVAVVMAALAAHPAVTAKVPAFPNYHQNFGAPAGAVASGKKAAGGGAH